MEFIRLFAGTALTVSVIIVAWYTAWRYAHRPVIGDMWTPAGGGATTRIVSLPDYGNNVRLSSRAVVNDAGYPRIAEVTFTISREEWYASVMRGNMERVR